MEYTVRTTGDDFLKIVDLFMDDIPYEVIKGPMIGIRDVKSYPGAITIGGVTYRRVGTRDEAPYWYAQISVQKGRSRARYWVYYNEEYGFDLDLAETADEDICCCKKTVTVDHRCVKYCSGEENDKPFIETTFKSFLSTKEDVATYIRERYNRAQVVDVAPALLKGEMFVWLVLAADKEKPFKMSAHEFLRRIDSVHQKGVLFALWPQGTFYPYVGKDDLYNQQKTFYTFYQWGAVNATAGHLNSSYGCDPRLEFRAEEKIDLDKEYFLPDDARQSGYSGPLMGIKWDPNIKGFVPVPFSRLTRTVPIKWPWGINTFQKHLCD